MTSDPISPSHYSRFLIQPKEFILKNKLNFFEGNIVKYVLRAPYKNGLEDLLKARSNLDDLIGIERERLAGSAEKAPRTVAAADARFEKALNESNGVHSGYIRLDDGRMAKRYVPGPRQCKLTGRWPHSPL